MWVLSREDPTESFLKGLPAGTKAVEVIYPVSGRLLWVLCAACHVHAA